MGTRGRGAPRWLHGAVAAVTLAGALLAPGQALAEEPALPAEVTSAPATTAPAGLPGIDGDRIEAKYAALGGPAGVLGAPRETKLCMDDVVCWQHFDHGSLFWSLDRSAAAYALTDSALVQAWQRTGGAFSSLVLGVGVPASDTFCGLPDGGCGQHFANGSIYRSARTSPVRIDGPIRDRWAADGWERGPLGYPVSAAFCGLRDTGCGQHFQGGSVYWSPASGAVAVRSGPIADLWAAQGWEWGRLGYPTGAAFCGLRNGGCGQHFQAGSVYWSPGSGAHVVTAPTGVRWGQFGWEFGPLGYPTSDPFHGVHHRVGQHFQGGSLYDTNWGVLAVLGPIRDRWAAQGWERGPLGSPTSDTFCGLRGGGCGQHFQNGSVYWSPATGARVVDRRFADRWARHGWEYGSLGYPTSEMFCGLRGGGCGQHFQGGSLYWNGETGGWLGTGTAYAVQGPFLAAWAAQGWENGRLGYPTGDAVGSGWNQGQRFYRGDITLINGRVTVRFE
ncbi:LGFP repeat-containing protein [Geodermatophilus nigrescens]|uniref:LGFP repeat-containing protein n=1 Tax=Geodermatophilus nigrescens TaxID=1070870 RepID=A0A1M5PWY4_9ACTN|nr:hypothetical protein [Geodermatophilus nigrescens]SHH06162.1 LGFP repeat-containing protein [Geodermatophilus nigrescens]